MATPHLNYKITLDLSVEKPCSCSMGVSPR